MTTPNSPATLEKKAPHVPAAFINAIAEEGTKAEAIKFLQEQWNENRQLVRELEYARKRAEDWKCRAIGFEISASSETGIRSAVLEEAAVLIEVSEHMVFVPDAAKGGTAEPRPIPHRRELAVAIRALKNAAPQDAPVRKEGDRFAEVGSLYKQDVARIEPATSVKNPTATPAEAAPLQRDDERENEEPAAPWRHINTCDPSDDLIWLRRGDSIEGPRPWEVDDPDYWDWWAPCDSPPTRRPLALSATTLPTYREGIFLDGFLAAMVCYGRETVLADMWLEAIQRRVKRMPNNPRLSDMIQAAIEALETPVAPTDRTAEG